MVQNVKDRSIEFTTPPPSREADVREFIIQDAGVWGQDLRLPVLRCGDGALVQTAQECRCIQDTAPPEINIRESVLQDESSEGAYLRVPVHSDEIEPRDGLVSSVKDERHKANKQPGFSQNATGQGVKINTVQYLGIAADEPERIERHTKKGIILPLVDIGWDEAYCRKWCEENDLLSPIYTTATRGGCWFCHNQGVGQLRLLRQNYPDLWALLLKWDSDSPVSFKSNGITVHDFDKRFQMEDEGKLKPGDRKFRWKQVLEPEEP